MDIIPWILLILAIVARYWWKRSDWSYHWDLGKYILPRANKTLQRAVGFVLWVSVYLIVGISLAQKYQISWYVGALCGLVFGILLVSATSLLIKSKRL